MTEHGDRGHLRGRSPWTELWRNVAWFRYKMHYLRDLPVSSCMYSTKSDLPVPRKSSSLTNELIDAIVLHHSSFVLIGMNEIRLVRFVFQLDHRYWIVYRRIFYFLSICFLVDNFLLSSDKILTEIGIFSLFSLKFQKNFFSFSFIASRTKFYAKFFFISFHIVEINSTCALPSNSFSIQNQYLVIRKCTKRKQIIKL